MRTREVIELMTLGNMRAASSAPTCGPTGKSRPKDQASQMLNSGEMFGI